MIADGEIVKTLHRGDYFGEIALMYDVPRTATVRTRSESHFFTLDRATFLVALTGSTSSYTAAQGLAEERFENVRGLGSPAAANTEA